MSEILFVATADTSDVDRKLSESADRAEEYKNRMVSYGEDVENQFKSTADAISAAIEKQKQTIASMQERLSQMRSEYSKAAPGPGRDEIAINIEGAEGVLQRETEALRYLEEQLAEVNAKLTDSTGLVQDWAAGFVTSTQKAGGGLKGISGALLDEIGKQKYILGSIAQDIKNVQREYNKMGAGVEKDALGKVLEQLNGAFENQQEIVGKAEKALQDYFETFSVEDLEDRLKGLKAIRETLYAEFKKKGTTPEGMSENAREINAVENALEKLKGKAGEAAGATGNVGKAGAAGMKGLIAGAGLAVLAIAALKLVFEALKGIILSNRVIADKFKVTMGGVSGAMREAARSIATGDWENFGKKMKQAAKDGKDFAQSQLYIKARMDESKVVLSEMELRQAKLNNTLKTGGLVGEERARLEQELLDNEKAMAEERTKLAEDRIASALKNTKLQKRYTQEEITELIKLAPAFEANREALEDYKKAREWLDNPKKSKLQELDLFTQHKFKTVVAETSEEVKGLYDNYVIWRRDTGKAYDELIPLIQEYNKTLAEGWNVETTGAEQTPAEGSVKKLRQELQDLKDKYDEVSTDLEREALIPQIDAKELELSKLELKGIKDETDAIPGSIKFVRDELDKLRDKYDSVGTAAERAALKVKIAAKEQQLAALEAADKTTAERLTDKKEEYDRAIASYVKASRAMDEAEAARYKAEAERLAGEILALQHILDLRERIAAEVLKETQKAKESKIITPKVAPELDTNLRPLSKDIAAKNAEKQALEGAKAAKEVADEELEVRLRIFDTVMSTANALGDILGIDPKVMEQINAMGSFAEGAMTGNWLQMIVSGIKFVADLIPSRTELLNQKLDEMNILLDKQQRLIEQSQRKGGEEKARAEEIKTLKEQLDLYEEELARWQKKLYNSEHAWNMFQSMATEKRRKKVQELTEAVQEAQAALEDAEQELDDFLSGGVTENTIADSIANAFRDGKTSVDDFASYMNDILIDAVTQAFSARILGDQITGLTDFIAQAIGDDGTLSQDELDKIKEWYNQIADSSEEIWEQLTSALDLGNDIGEPSALAGGIQRQITEDTASELAGLMRKISDDNRMNRDYNRLTVDRLTNIEAYTQDSMESLRIAVIELKAINSNTKPVYAGDL